MAKRRPIVNAELVRRKTQAGHGQGVGEEYRPWLRIQDVPSRGVVSRIRSRKNGRIMHLMSMLEQQVALCLDSSPHVLDLREQFPLLPLDSTLTIADRQGIKHPADPWSREEIIMTTDFLVTVAQDDCVRDMAVAVKYSSDLCNARVQDKLGIERQYWQEQGIEWRIITEQNLGRQFVRNLLWLHPYGDISSLWPHRSNVIADVAVTLTSLASHGPQCLADLCEQCDAHLGMRQRGLYSLAVARYLLANRLWITDLRTFRLHAPLHLQHVADDIRPLIAVAL